MSIFVEIVLVKDSMKRTFPHENGDGEESPPIEAWR
jgi:hypothetical protein